MRNAYENYFKIGVAVNTWQIEGQNEFAPAKDLIPKHFNSITMENEMKPEKLISKENVKKGDAGEVIVNIDRLDKVLSIVKKTGVLLRGHCLVWHGQTPEFFFHVDYDEKKDYATKEVMTKRLESYIRQVLTFCKENYPGLIYAWDVVNEAIHDDGNPRNEETSNWYRIYQDTSYINEAFAYAKKYAEEGTSLFYNDYEEYAPDKLAGIYKKVKELYAEGNIDGVGMQSHYIMDYPSVELVEEAIDKYNSIAPGEIEIQLTELDIHNTDNSEESQDELAKRYVDFFKMLVAKKKAGVNITNVTVWGLDDETTWLTGFRKEKSYPLLFDKDYNEKKSFKELIKLSKEL